VQDPIRRVIALSGSDGHRSVDDFSRDDLEVRHPRPAARRAVCLASADDDAQLHLVIGDDIGELGALRVTIAAVSERVVLVLEPRGLLLRRYAHSHLARPRRGPVQPGRRELGSDQPSPAHLSSDQVRTTHAASGCASSSSSSTSASRVRRFLVDNHFDSPSTAISSTPQMKFDANAEPDQLPSDMLMPVCSICIAAAPSRMAQSRPVPPYGSMPATTAMRIACIRYELAKDTFAAFVDENMISPAMAASTPEVA